MDDSTFIISVIVLLFILIYKHNELKRIQKRIEIIDRLIKLGEKNE